MHRTIEKFGARRFIRSNVIERPQILKFWSRDPDHAHFRGQFIVRWLVHQYETFTELSLTIRGVSYSLP